MSKIVDMAKWLKKSKANRQKQVDYQVRTPELDTHMIDVLFTKDKKSTKREIFSNGQA